MTLDGVRAHQAAFQAAADANGGTRAAGTPGYAASAEYVAQTMAAAGYNVYPQYFSFDRWVAPTAALQQVSPLSVSYTRGSDFSVFSYSPGGDVTAAVSPVDVASFDSGCEPADFAGFTPGTIALMRRGTCEFRVKALNAEAAGATGAIIFNDGTPGRTGVVTGTLLSDFAGHIPVVGIATALGEEFVLEAGTGLVVRIDVDVLVGTVHTANIFAETAGGDPDHVIVVGGHLDSVDQGPGIQDNGSGSAAILETAIQMAGVDTRNKVRFVWWGAEEYGLLGSWYYLNTLSGAELDRIDLYLNFDMIGSPNYIRAVYDGDGSHGPAGPPGSDVIEDVIGGFYTARGLVYEPFTLEGGSDFYPFAQYGVPVGGVFTGAGAVKTPAQAAVYGGTAGDAYDPCYHLACDTYANYNAEVLDLNADIVASAVLTFAMNSSAVSGSRGKGNFRPAGPPVTPPVGPFAAGADRAVR